MLNLFDEGDTRHGATHDFFRFLQKIVKGSKKSNNTEDNTSTMGTNYKAKFLEAQRKLDLLEKELNKLSDSMKSDTYVYWNHSSDFVRGMERYSRKVDCIIDKCFTGREPDPFGTGGWVLPIFRPALAKNVF